MNSTDMDSGDSARSPWSYARRLLRAAHVPQELAIEGESSRLASDRAWEPGKGLEPLLDLLRSSSFPTLADCLELADHPSEDAVHAGDLGVDFERQHLTPRRSSDHLYLVDRLGDHPYTGRSSR